MFATFFLSVSQTFRRHPSNCHPVAVFTQEYSQSWGLTLASLHPCRVAMSICTKKWCTYYIFYMTWWCSFVWAVYHCKLWACTCPKVGGYATVCNVLQKLMINFEGLEINWSISVYFILIHFVFFLLEGMLEVREWTCQPHLLERVNWKAFAAITKQYRWISC